MKIISFQFKGEIICEYTFFPILIQGGLNIYYQNHNYKAILDDTQAISYYTIYKDKYEKMRIETPISANFIITDNETVIIYVLFNEQDSDIYNYIENNQNEQFQKYKDKMKRYNKIARQKIFVREQECQYLIQFNSDKWKNEIIISNDNPDYCNGFFFRVEDNKLNIKCNGNSCFDLYCGDKRICQTSQYEIDQNCTINYTSNQKIQWRIDIIKQVITGMESTIISDKSLTAVSDNQIDQGNNNGINHISITDTQEDEPQLSNDIQPSFILSGNQEYFFPCPELSPIEVDAQYILTTKNRVLCLFLSGYPQKLQYNVSMEQLQNNVYAKNIALYCHFRAIPIKNIENNQQIKVQIEVPSLQFVLDFDHQLLANKIPAIMHMTEVSDILTSLEIVIATKQLYKFYIGDYLWTKYGKWLRQRLSGSQLVYRIDQLDNKYKVYTIQEIYNQIQFIQLKKAQKSFKNILNDQTFQ